MTSKELYKLLDKLGMINELDYELFNKQLHNLADTIDFVDDLCTENSDEYIKRLLVCLFYRGDKDGK